MSTRMIGRRWMGCDAQFSMSQRRVRASCIVSDVCVGWTSILVVLVGCMCVVFDRMIWLGLWNDIIPASVSSLERIFASRQRLAMRDQRNSVTNPLRLSDCRRTFSFFGMAAVIPWVPHSPFHIARSSLSKRHLTNIRNNMTIAAAGNRSV
jgi:hypothetical protein